MEEKGRTFWDFANDHPITLTIIAWALTDAAIEIARILKRND